MNNESLFKKKPISFITSQIKRKGHSRDSKSQGGQRSDTISRVSTRPDTDDQSISKSSFAYHYAIGRGGFGRV